MFLRITHIDGGQITYLEEYYLTNHEIDVLTASAKDMISKIPTGSMIVELGSG